MSVLLPAATSILAILFSLALFDQWRERRHAYQLIWAIGMLFFGIASGCEAIAAGSGWNEALYRTWYLTGAVWTAGWLGLGTAFLLGRTRFGYTFALCLFLAGLFTFLTQAKYQYPGSGSAPILYLIAAIVWRSRSASRPTSRTSAGRTWPPWPSSARPCCRWS